MTTKRRRSGRVSPTNFSREALHVYVPLRYYRRPKGLEDEHAYAQVSRFLTPQVRARFDERTVVPAETDTPRRAGRHGPTTAAATVAAFLDDLWRT